MEPSTELIQHCEMMVGEGGSVEMVLSFLRRAGYSKITAIRILMHLQAISLGQAKQVVHLSDAWRDTRVRDDTLHDALEQAAEHLADNQQHEK